MFRGAYPKRRGGVKGGVAWRSRAVYARASHVHGADCRLGSPPPPCRILESAIVPTLREVGEVEAIRVLTRDAASRGDVIVGPGDDAAVLR